MDKNILILFAVVAVVGGGLWFINSKDSGIDNVVSDSRESIVQEESVQLEDILVDTKQEADLVGFYRVQERGGPPMFPQTYQCDQFVVTEGGETFTQSFRDMVESGNSVNQIDENGYLVLNLNFSEVTAANVSLIKSSAVTNPVSVSLEKVEQGLGQGTGPCHSFVNITKVK